MAYIAHTPIGLAIRKRVYKDVEETKTSYFSNDKKTALANAHKNGSDEAKYYIEQYFLLRGYCNAEIMLRNGNYSGFFMALDDGKLD